MPDPGDGPLVVAVDQGTSSTKAIALDVTGAVVGECSVPVARQHPRPGEVEQDPEEIAASVVAAVLGAAEGRLAHVAALGLSTQRESAVLWDRRTGRALGPLLGWQDRRTLPLGRELTRRGAAARIRAITGLPLDPMFSALKFAWLLDAVDPDRTRSASGELALGTVDSWLVFGLTGEHRIEAGNASRTQLLDLATFGWSDELLELFRIPPAALPRIVASDEPSDPLRGVPGLPAGARIHGVLGDSHAALFGHGVRKPGVVKVTLGTGSSVMGLTDRPDTGAALARTVAWAAPEARYAFEGNILSSGATLVWLGEVLGLGAGELVDLGLGADDGGVDLVPAFAGLGAPWWDDRARAVLTGFDLGTGRSALARAAVESVVLQIEDVLAAADPVSGGRITTVAVDGGPAANDRLVQLLADLSGRVVRRPAVAGLSGIGAAHLAGLTAGVWDAAAVAGFDRGVTEFSPALDADRAHERRARWHEAVARARLRPSIHPLEEESTP